MAVAFSHLLVMLGALFGAGGVALSATATHAAGGANLETAARFLLLTAPVLILVPLSTRAGLAAPALGLAAGGLIGFGCLLFSGDLALRALRGVPLFPRAAPTGGMLMIGGFALLAAAALWALAARER